MTDSIGSERTEISSEQFAQWTYSTIPYLDHTLDNAYLETTCPLDNGNHHSKKPQHSAGLLDLLPFELVFEVLVRLNIPDLTSFRRVNRRAMELVNSIDAYRAVWEHCPNVIRAILSIEATSFSCTTLYETLRTSECEVCGRFGGYLYLLTCQRVCFMCYDTDWRYSPVAMSQAEPPNSGAAFLRTHLSRALSLPEPFVADSPQNPRERLILYDLWEVLEFKEKNITNFSTWEWDHHDLVYAARRYKHGRFSAFVKAPFLSPAHNSADWGVYCAGCRHDTGEDSATHFTVKFTKDGFLEHIRSLGPLKAEGSRYTHEPLAASLSSPELSS
ncbi:hypothetical protein G7046_g598 [Stylonectria norvegica]|nr:hypothetical protein G7046_g598 [Stylonectria norvegica]